MPASNKVYECLQESGWDVEITWDGAIEASSATIPTAQRDLYEEASAACWGEISDRVSRMTTSEIEDVYHRELETRTCLIENGYSVDTPPSVHEYVDRFHGDRWQAYGASTIATGPLTDAEWARIAQACPQPAWSLGVPD